MNTHKNIEDNTVTNSKIWLTQRGIPSTTQTSQPPRKDKKKVMRDEERESDEEVNSFVIMVKDDLMPHPYDHYLPHPYDHYNASSL